MKQPTYVFIATGIGITPFRSMIHSLIDTNKKTSILLFYKTKPHEILYKDIFSKAKEHGVETVYLTEKEELSAALLKAYINNLHSPLYYLSGPQPIVEAHRSLLRELGIEQTRIKTDLFSGYE